MYKSWDEYKARLSSNSLKNRIFDSLDGIYTLKFNEFLIIL